MDERAWARLALAAIVLCAVLVALLGALWSVPMPPAALPERASPVRLADAAPTVVAEADPEQVRAGVKALDAVLAARVAQEARDRHVPAPLPAPEAREAAIAAGDTDRLLAAWAPALAALGVSYQ